MDMHLGMQTVNSPDHTRVYLSVYGKPDGETLQVVMEWRYDSMIPRPEKIEEAPSYSLRLLQEMEAFVESRLFIRADLDPEAPPTWSHGGCFTHEQ
jgi:hypothetical protein